jgi:hypothetical protein
MVDQLHDRDVAGKKDLMQSDGRRKEIDQRATTQNGAHLLCMFRAGRSRAVLLNL